MNRPLILSLFAAVVIVVMARPAYAREALRSSPFHRCVVAALAATPGEVIEVEIDGITGEVLEVSERPR